MMFPGDGKNAAASAPGQSAGSGAGKFSRESWREYDTIVYSFLKKRKRKEKSNGVMMENGKTIHFYTKSKEHIHISTTTRK
jgi:hypothetical protein